MKSPRWAVQLTLGLALVGSAWLVSWNGPEPARFHTFFVLWVGYIAVVDALVLAVSGTSLARRMRVRFLALFAISMPFWWIFEAANSRLENWRYHLPRDYSWLGYHLEASLAFSTVVPAVFVTAELVRQILLRRPVLWIRIAPDSPALLVIAAGGAMLFAATMVWPDVLFPMVWISLFLAIDPVVHLLGGRSITAQVISGRWDTVLVIFMATLTCGFFWEMWNSRAMPKWTYDIPYAEWLHVFEMPLLGYGGYLPFGLELYALVNLADRMLGLGLARHLRFDQAARES